MVSVKVIVEEKAPQPSTLLISLLPPLRQQVYPAALPPPTLHSQLSAFGFMVKVKLNCQLSIVNCQLS